MAHGIPAQPGPLLRLVGRGRAAAKAHAPLSWRTRTMEAMENSDKPEPTMSEPAPPVRPPPFESPWLHPMRPEDRVPEGESILTFVPKR